VQLLQPVATLWFTIIHIVCSFCVEFRAGALSFSGAHVSAADCVYSGVQRSERMNAKLQKRREYRKLKYLGPALRWNAAGSYRDAGAVTAGESTALCDDRTYRLPRGSTKRSNRF
jgi:hypothetical protein